MDENDLAVLLMSVKGILMIVGSEMDAALMPLMLGVIGYMENAGITDDMIRSSAGAVTLALGTNDMWSLTPGAADFSPGFLNMVKQLKVMSDVSA